MYLRQRNPYDSTGSLAPSNQTFSNWCWMGDFAQISVQVYNNSVVTIYGTNKPGWTLSLNTVNDASVLTALAAAGVVKIEPGMGWVQFQRSTSTQTVFYIGQSRN